MKNYDYDAFGNEVNPDANDTNPFRHCGEYFDLSSGTYYLRARHYDPGIGRFISEDSVLGLKVKMVNGFEYDDPLSLNLYTYAYNNPVLYCDPGGHSIALAQGSINSLSGALPWLASGITAGVASVKTAIATSWAPVVAIGAATVAVVSIAVVVDKANKLGADATKAMTWVDTQVSTRSVDPNKLRDNTVYVIIDNITSKVVYVGRTSNYSSRQYRHQEAKNARFTSADFTMTPVATGLTHNESRALEQTLITAYTLQALKNSINSIADKNLKNFTYEIKRVESLISSYFDD